MALVYGGWVDCSGDSAIADRIFANLPRVLLFRGSEFDVDVRKVSDGGRSYLHVVPAVPRKSDLPQDGLRELMNALAKAMADVEGYRFAVFGLEVDGLTYEELVGDLVALQDHAGLIISEDIVKAVGKMPSGFEAFGRGYYWRPYVSELVN